VFFDVAGFCFFVVCIWVSVRVGKFPAENRIGPLFVWERAEVWSARTFVLFLVVGGSGAQPRLLLIVITDCAGVV
jgi:hypothetical protein